LSGFYYYHHRKKKQLSEQQNEYEKTLLKLSAIRAQLNPHFIFNSLSSIQGLINTNKINDANKYLEEFSSLIRNTLVDGDKLYHNLDKEIKTLATYLHLEQLRFRFEYNIKTDDNLNANEIKIPSFLLQPLVENAVKHGVSQLREKGKLYIHFFRRDNNMVAEIRDNGEGFNNEINGTGYGLKLTNSRIELINKMVKGQTILMKNFRENNETVIQLNFNNWI
jgi:LytS/YehU family sensor histidine kinase